MDCDRKDPVLVLSKVLYYRNQQCTDPKNKTGTDFRGMAGRLQLVEYCPDDLFLSSFSLIFGFLVRNSCVIKVSSPQ